MKKQFLTAALMLISGSVLAAGDTSYRVSVHVTQGDVSLGPYSAVVRDGEEFHYSKVETVDITKHVVTTSDGKSKETLQPMKVGFDFRATPRQNVNGDILLDYSYVDARIDDMQKVPVGDVDMKLPTASQREVSSQIVVEEGAPVVLFNSRPAGNDMVIFTLVKE